MQNKSLLKGLLYQFYVIVFKTKKWMYIYLTLRCKKFTCLNVLLMSIVVFLHLKNLNNLLKLRNDIIKYANRLLFFVIWKSIKTLKTSDN